jgi:hypothetical protein
MEEVSLEAFGAWRALAVRAHVAAGYPPAEMVERPLPDPRAARYHLLANNYEHFCECAIMGKSSSVQVKRFVRSPARLGGRHRDAWVRARACRLRHIAVVNDAPARSRRRRSRFGRGT